MAALTLVAVGALALVVFVLLGAVLELFRDVRQVRDAVGILDRPLQVELGPVQGERPGRFGLPAELDGASAALVLFLSDRCGTCRALASSFGSSLPPGLWIVLEARGPREATAFLERHGLSAPAASGRVAVDVAGAIAGRIGLDTTPVGFRVEDGVFTSATTVPSVRYLASILPRPLHLYRSRGPGRNGDGHAAAAASGTDDRPADPGPAGAGSPSAAARTRRS